MKVLNYDKNGNEIKDLSKVQMPKDVSDLFVRMLLKHREEVKS